MKIEDQRKLATKLGCDTALDPKLFVFYEDELATYTANVEAPLLERITQYEEALLKLAKLGNGNCFGNSFGNIIAIDVLKKYRIEEFK